MKIRTISLFLALLLLFWAAVSQLDMRRQREGRAQLEAAIRRSAVTCYALEGFYPPDITYLQRHYGLQVDEEAYIVHYALVASNWMPDITVLERTP